MNPIPVDFLKMVLQNETAGKFEYIDEPLDKGGPTKSGVTQLTLSLYLGRVATIDDLKNLSLKDWSSIISKNYWVKPNLCNLNLPKNVMAMYFDSCIMSGPFKATQLMQKVVNVPADGILGPNTIKACEAFYKAYGEYRLIEAYTILRVNYYKQIVLNNRSQSKWLNGWTNRARSFLKMGNLS